MNVFFVSFLVFFKWAFLKAARVEVFGFLGRFFYNNPAGSWCSQFHKENLEFDWPKVRFIIVWRFQTSCKFWCKFFVFLYNTVINDHRFFKMEAFSFPLIKSFSWVLIGDFVEFHLGNIFAFSLISASFAAMSYHLQHCRNTCNIVISLAGLLRHFKRCCVIYSIVYILSAPCSPVLGFIVDRFGYNVYWVLIAVVTTLGCHGLLGLTFINPWVPMVSVIPAWHRAERVTALLFFLILRIIVVWQESLEIQ